MTKPGAVRAAAGAAWAAAAGVAGAHSLILGLHGAGWSSSQSTAWKSSLGQMPRAWRTCQQEGRGVGAMNMDDDGAGKRGSEAAIHASLRGGGRQERFSPPHAPPPPPPPHTPPAHLIHLDPMPTSRSTRSSCFMPVRRACVSGPGPAPPPPYERGWCRAW